MPFKLNPITGKLDLVNSSSGGASDPFITDGTNGVLTITWETSGGYVYDMTVDNTGHVVTTLVSSPPSGTTGQSMGLLLALTYPT